ncbi:hypothetical protein [Leptospira santarosai]|uniref:hypothetical protein n=1 Tax=Leptospira santarosai TaxID=28183 RepID=UPI000AEB1CA6
MSLKIGSICSFIPISDVRVPGVGVPTFYFYGKMNVGTKTPDSGYNKENKSLEDE